MYREVKKKRFVKLKFSLVFHEIVVKYRNKAILPKKRIFFLPLYYFDICANNMKKGVPKSDGTVYNSEAKRIREILKK